MGSWGAKSDARPQPGRDPAPWQVGAEQSFVSGWTVDDRQVDVAGRHRVDVSSPNSRLPAKVRPTTSTPSPSVSR